MNKDEQNLVLKIIDDFKTKPIEEIYSYYFASRFVDRIDKIEGLEADLMNIFYLVFNGLGNEKDSILKSKFEFLLKSVSTAIEFNQLTCFPTYIDLYIDFLYRKNGLLNVNRIPIFIYKDYYHYSFVHFSDCPPEIEEYEIQLFNCQWLTDFDKEKIRILKGKREIVKPFEKFIYDFEKELSNVAYNLENTEYIENAKTTLQKHINKIKFELAEFRLFGGLKNGQKEETYLNLIHYFESIYTIDELDWIELINEKDETLERRRGDQSFKINLLHQYGIIQHLRKVWEINNPTKKIEDLISDIIGAKTSSIQPLLSNPKDNRLRTSSMNNKLESYLEKYNLLIDKIKQPN